MNSHTPGVVGTPAIGTVGWGRIVKSAGMKVAAAVAAWRNRRADRIAAAHLRALSDKELKDIGICRGQINLAVLGQDVRGVYRGPGI